MRIVALKGKLVSVVVGAVFLVSPAFAAENSNPYDVLRSGLMGAAVGAASAEFSGGKAGTGALIGAGSNVIGKALFDVLFPSNPYQPAYSQPTYHQPTYYQPTHNQPVYYTPSPQSYPQSAPIYYSTPVYYSTPTYYRTSYQAPRREVIYQRQEPVYNGGYARTSTDPNRQIIRSGLMGAAIGAISAEASGGKAGTGALIGAGSNVIGGSLLEILFPQN